MNILANDGISPSGEQALRDAGVTPLPIPPLPAVGRNLMDGVYIIAQFDLGPDFERCGRRRRGSPGPLDRTGTAIINRARRFNGGIR